MGIDDLAGADDSMVYALYDGLLGRAPDSAGLTQWMAHLQGGDSLRDVAQAMMASPEAQARMGGLDDHAFVERLYEDTLHRHGDDAGLKGWDNSLSHGSSRADVALGFVMSDEHLSHIKSVFDAGDVGRLYYGLLNRAPDAGGLHDFRDALEHGASLPDIAQAFLASPEYQAKSAGSSNAGYVDDLYEHALGRHADDTGLHHWQDMLEHGTSRATVAAMITDSVEAHHHLASGVELAWHL